MTRPPWDFEYVPVIPGRVDDGYADDMIVALSSATELEVLQKAAGPLSLAAPAWQRLLSRAPLYWWRLRVAVAVRRADVAETLGAAGLAVRYVASSSTPSLTLPPPWADDPGLRVSPASWPTRRGIAKPDPDSPGRWFLRRETGIDVHRGRLGSGAGTRLAVIDDDAAYVSELELDSEVLVGLEEAPRSTLHGATMVALAVGTRRTARDSVRWEAFGGVAPFASPRLYCIPKPGHEIVTLPLAIIQAVSDGADVVLCATYLEGTTSPMMEDALNFASRCGRKGRGAAIVMPVGREASSPADSVHASLCMSLVDPASDPRVFAIGPSGKEGGWFFWRDKKGRLRPFANRGPAIRWLAPGDDLTFPFARTERLGHAESSGASAIAAGVVLLVIAANPSLLLSELDSVLTRTLSDVAPDAFPPGTLADPREADPSGRDPDGHNAKNGYGRLNVGRACLTAADPVCAALVAIGEERAAASYMRSTLWIRRPYSKALGRWMVRAMMADPVLDHAAKVLARHVRLVANRTDRWSAHPPGGVLRHLTLLLRSARASRRVPRRSRRVSEQLSHLSRLVESLLVGDTSVETKLYGALQSLWA